MANESLKAKLEAYEAACAKSYAKTPERVGLKHNKVYTPYCVLNQLFPESLRKI